MAESKGFIGEFREFISRGSVMDMAVGVIIGGSFKVIVDSLVGDIIMPIISKFGGGLDFSNWFIALDGGSYSTLAAAQEVGAATLNYGAFITAIINFLIMAFIIFTMVKTMNRFATIGKNTGEEPVVEATTKICGFCKSEIAIEATRCPNCTSHLE